MFFSRYSLIMALLLFTLLAILAGITARRANWKSFGFVFIIAILSILRFLLPIEFIRTSIVIPDPIVYPFIDRFLRKELLTNLYVLHILCIIWLIGAVVSLFHLALRLYNQWIFMQHCALSKIHPLYEICNESAHFLGMSFTGTLGKSPNFSTPFMIGLFRPNIIVPMDIETMPTEQISHIFYHELQHFKKKDLWIKLVLNVLSCVLWWNPVMKFFQNGIDHMLELRCDKNVCCFLTAEEQVSYSFTLLQMTKKQGISNKLITAGYNGRGNDKNIQNRFKQILSRNEHEKNRFSILVLILSIVLFIFSYQFTLQPHYSEPQIEHETVIENNSDDNSFILRKKDGTLEYYSDNFHRSNLTEDMLDEEPYCNIPIYDSY